MKILLAALLLVARLTQADSLILTGLGEFGGRSTAYFYFPDTGAYASVSPDAPQSGITLIAVNTAKGTVRIRRDGVEQALFLGQGALATGMGTEETPHSTRGGLFPNRTMEEQRKLDLEAVQHAISLSLIDLKTQNRLRQARESRRGIKP